MSQTLGHYDLTDQIGEGPFTITYRAADRQANRRVIVKILKAEAATDSSKRTRFEEEAKAMSALNHANIAHVYEFASANGVDYVAGEYVQGESLAEALGRKRLRRKESLSYAEQVIGALDSAHAAGVVHGRVKPSNIQIAGKVRAKLTDFGVARLSDGVPIDADSLPEGTSPDQFAYLSPEQIRGEVPTPQSDVFSFGAVLYHMVSGQSPFLRDTSAATFHAILHQEPPPPSRFTSRAPKGIEKVLSRCLAKDPKQRPASIADLIPDLHAMREEYESAKETKGSFLGENWERVLLWSLAAVFFLAAVGGGVYWWLTRPTHPADSTTLKRITEERGLDSEPAFNQAGDLIAFASDRAGNLDIWVQPLSGRDPRQVTTHPSDDREPALSPDGRWLAFRSERDGGGVYIVPAEGGEERLVGPGGRRPRFSPDSSQIAYWTGPVGLGPAAVGEFRTFVAPVAGGEPVRVAVDFVSAAMPLWAPDGQRLLVLAVRDPSVAPVDWWLIPVGAGAPESTGACATIRTAGIHALAACPPPADWREGAVYFAAGPGDGKSSLYRLELSESAAAVNGTPLQLTHRESLDTAPTAAPDGRFVFARQTMDVGIWVLPLSAGEAKPAGELKRITSSASVETYPTVSADGRRMVYLSDGKGPLAPWLRELDTGKEEPLTDGRQEQLWPRINPSGDRVVFTELRIGAFEHFVAPVGTGPMELLCDVCGATVSDWLPDGASVLIEMRPEAGTRSGIALARVASRERTMLLTHPVLSVAQVRLSPDGQWLAFVGREDSGDTKLFLAPFRAGGVPPAAWTPITAGGHFDSAPQWSRDGRFLYYISSREGHRTILAQPLAGNPPRPDGEPRIVHRFSQAARSPSLVALNGLDMFVAADALYLTVGEVRGALWLGERP
ncbi:MAG: serine/threonine-protein kinase [Bryobacterales bacterium]|nr:serine/threonine-protein kinase [Bryobacterales bacterium]